MNTHLQNVDPNTMGTDDMLMSHMGDNYHQYQVDMPLTTGYGPMEGLVHDQFTASDSYYGTQTQMYALQNNLGQVEQRVTWVEHKTVPVLSQIWARIAQLERQVLEHTREAAEHKQLMITSNIVFEDLKATTEKSLMSAEQAQKKATLVTRDARTKIQAHIHEVADGLLGIGGRDPVTRKTVKTLPYPRAAGEVNDGSFRPVWSAGVEDMTNTVFVDHVANIVYGYVVEDQKSETPKLGNINRSDIGKMMKTYFNTLHFNYTNQTTVEGQLRLEQKRLEGKRHARIEDKCNDLRMAIPEFEAKYGLEATVGVAGMIVAEYMSSEHSDEGDADPVDFAQNRIKMGGGMNGFEVRDKPWRSRQFKLVNTSLRTIQNAQRNRTRDPTTGEKLSTAGKVCIPQFKGLKINDNNNPPPARHDRIPYESMVDATWKARMEAQGLSIPVLPMPAELTIFSR
ncbi:hypothetical protein C8R43DRAFT_1120616 [Mycena crocata]|nr:hypothetical protein C8R43DRAFT_1120616 [Mycena crocata]